MPFKPVEASLTIDTEREVKTAPKKGGFKPVRKGYAFGQDGEDVGKVGEFLAEVGPTAWSYLMERPGAAVRAKIRGRSMKEAFDAPETEERFQDEWLRKLNASMPENAGTLKRFLAGAPASTAGLAADFLTNPGEIALALATEGASKAAGGMKYGATTLGEIASETPISRLPRVLARGKQESAGAIERLQAMRVKSAGQKRVAELLQPAGKEFDETLAAGNVPGELKEGFNTIKKVSTPKKLVETFDDEIGKVMDFRDRLIQQHNKPVSQKFVAKQAARELEKTYGKGLGQLKGAEKKKVTQLFKDEMQILKDQGELDTIKAQSRKEFLQNETKTLLNKQRRGETVIVDPHEQVVKDAFRRALRGEIDRAHPDISKLNARFDGLDNARDWASKIQAEALRQPSDFMRRLTQILGRPNTQGRAAAAVREIPFMKKPLKGDTAKIEGMRNKYGELMEKSRKLSKPDPEEVTLDYTTEEQLLLAPTDAYLKRIMGPERLKELAMDHRPETKLLPQGQGFELVDAEEAAGRLRLKKFQDEVQLEEGRNVRETKSFPLTREAPYSRQGNPDAKRLEYKNDNPKLKTAKEIAMKKARRKGGK